MTIVAQGYALDPTQVFTVVEGGIVTLSTTDLEVILGPTDLDAGLPSDFVVALDDTDANATLDVDLIVGLDENDRDVSLICDG